MKFWSCHEFSWSGQAQPAMRYKAALSWLPSSFCHFTGSDLRRLRVRGNDLSRCCLLNSSTGLGSEIVVAQASIVLLRSPVAQTHSGSSRIRKSFAILTNLSILCLTIHSSTRCSEDTHLLIFLLLVTWGGWLEPINLRREMGPWVVSRQRKDIDMVHLGSKYSCLE